MEDSHCHILSLPDDPDAAFFAVYDGHGGNNIAKYSSKHLHKYILKQPEYETNIEEAIIKGFLDLDHVMLTDDSLKDQMAGSTAVTILIKNNKLYCGNCGDSRAIGCKNGNVVVLSNDHKPMNPEESSRIYKAGGWVEFNRVNGNLALSRALGDYIFKRNDDKSAEEQIVTALPEVLSFDLSEEWEFIVLACDGIWDVLSNQEVVDFVVKCIAEGKYPEDICEELLSYCLAPVCQMGGLGGDNMTLIIVCLLHGQPYENLIERCKKLHAEREKKRNDIFNNINVGGEGKKDNNNAHERITITPLSVESLMNAYFAQGGPSCFQTVGKSAKQTVENTTTTTTTTTDDTKLSPSSSSSPTSSPTSCTSSSSPEICDVRTDEKKEEILVKLSKEQEQEQEPSQEKELEEPKEMIPKTTQLDSEKNVEIDESQSEIKIDETEESKNKSQGSDENKNVSEN
jgi:protein phosphatase 2C family protein 2/3